jgi:ferrochelatase
MSPPIGVLVMAHGTPASLEEIEAFYTRIRRGRPPSPEQLENLVRRYRAIGGTSPLTERTRAQTEGLAAALEASSPGRYLVGFGAKHTEPSIETGAAALAGAGVSAVVGLVLTPQRSAAGSGEYLDRAARAVAECAPDLPFVAVEEWYDAPGFDALVGRRVTTALGGLESPTVLFSAHSVPESVAEPYRTQVVASAELVAGAAGLDRHRVPWRVVFQSAGRTEQRWLGPDLLGAIDEVAATDGRSVLVCPVGFVADHLEVLYDLDVEAGARARAAGLAFARTASLNDDPEFVGILAQVVASAAGASR